MKALRRLKWFAKLVWQPYYGGRITIREAWDAAGSLA